MVLCSEGHDVGVLCCDTALERRKKEIVRERSMGYLCRETHE